MTLQSSPVADDKAAVQPSESYSCETRQWPACSAQQQIASLMSIADEWAVTGCWIKTIISAGWRTEQPCSQHNYSSIFSSWGSCVACICSKFGEREKFWFIYLFLLINTFSAWLPSTARWCCEHRQDSRLDKCVAGWQVALGETSLYMCHTWAPYTACTLNNQLHNWLQLYNWLHNWLYNWLQLYNWLYNCNQLCNQFYNCLQLYNWL